MRGVYRADSGVRGQSQREEFTRLQQARQGNHMICTIFMAIIRLLEVILQINKCAFKNILT